ncbi:MAG TPA: hypothetical protein VJK48_00740 [Chlamydiales bacterium]|nr:hypothetical protein [Chlamydiales bacterium]
MRAYCNRCHGEFRLWDEEGISIEHTGLCRRCVTPEDSQREHGETEPAH